MTIKVRCARREARTIGIAVLVMILICSGPYPTLAADGDLDQTFGKSGVVVSDLDRPAGPFGTFNEGRAIAIQPDGKIVAADQTHLTGTTMNTVIARYNSDGSLDPSFGSAGKFVITTHQDPPNVIAIQADGKIVSGSFAGLMRVTTDGQLDTGFGSGGMVSTGKTAIYKLAMQPDGKIISAGDAIPDGPGGVPDGSTTFSVLRFNADGSPDPSFGIGGQATADFAGHAAGVSALAIQPDGKILAGGASRTGGPTGSLFAALARFNSDGTLDPGFGSSGLVATQQLSIVFRALAVLDGGQIVAIGGIGPPNIDNLGIEAVFGAARYNHDGSLDRAFGNGGVLTSPFFTARNTLLITAAIAPDGRFVAAGESENGLALARYNSDGSPDSSFGTGGTVITHVTDAKDGYPDTIRGIAYQTDGRMVVTGDANDDTDLVLARYNAASDFALTFPSATVTMAPGTKARITLNIARLGGYTGNVTITPPDTSALDVRISPNPETTSDDSVTFKIKVRGDTPLGSHDLVFAGQSDTGLAHSITLTLVVRWR
jgi:uncharacterized delta-60 repeat protein